MQVTDLTRTRIENERKRRNRRSALYDACLNDIIHFVNEYAMIDDVQGHGEGTGIMPFKLWPAQVDMLFSFISCNLLLILKARQLGISWLCCVYALWLCLFHRGKVVLIFSKGQDEANELLRRVTVMYMRLPEELKEFLPQVINQNTELIEWSNGSRIKSMPATRSSGRTHTASLVITDEFAYIMWAKELYTAVKPTVDAGGQLIILSTANGSNNLFYELYHRTTKGLGEFTFRFLSWRDRPDRDEDWYARTSSDSVQSSLMAQEYPSSPDEAFASTGSERFLPTMLWWDACLAVLPPLGEDEPLVLAADAGTSSDMFALVGVTRIPVPVLEAEAEPRDKVAVRYVRVWRAPYGGKIDFDEVEEEIRKVCENFNVIALAYDAYQLHQMMMGLRKEGVVWASEFSQMGKRLEADKNLLDMIMSVRVLQDGNQELRDAVENADRKVDAEERKLRIVKRVESLKIDPLVALSMATKLCMDLNL